MLLCDPVVEGDTGAEGTDALGVPGVAAVGDTPLGVDAGAEGTDALGVLNIAAVGAPVLDITGFNVGALVATVLGE